MLVLPLNLTKWVILILRLPHAWHQFIDLQDTSVTASSGSTVYQFDQRHSIPLGWEARKMKCHMRSKGEKLCHVQYLQHCCANAVAGESILGWAGGSFWLIADHKANKQWSVGTTGQHLNEQNKAFYIIITTLSVAICSLVFEEAAAAVRSSHRPPLSVRLI